MIRIAQEPRYSVEQCGATECAQRDPTASRDGADSQVETPGTTAIGQVAPQSTAVAAPTPLNMACVIASTSRISSSNTPTGHWSTEPSDLTVTTCKPA